MKPSSPRIQSTQELRAKLFGEDASLQESNDSGSHPAVLRDEISSSQPHERLDLTEQHSPSSESSPEVVHQSDPQDQAPADKHALGLVVVPPPLLRHLPPSIEPFMSQDGTVYIGDPSANNATALRVGSREADAVITAAAYAQQVSLRRVELTELNEALRTWAVGKGERKNVWYRVAPIQPLGIEIDLGDAQRGRVRIAAGEVTEIPHGSDEIFYRTSSMRAIVFPAAVGHLDALKKYVNLHVTNYPLFIAWLSYVLAHPKVSTTKYPILVLQGGQGSGKTSLCHNIILRLIDPSAIGVQRMPANEKDLAIAVQHAHVVAFDNVRGFKSTISDLFCIVSTGGQVISRQLYTDAEKSVLNLHGALVLNGIHGLVNQSDLAQRCLTLQLLPIPDEKRQSDADIMRMLEQDLPAIQRGLFDLIAAIFQHLPTAKVEKTERMIDFVRWLAAMEAAQGVPTGVFQREYSELLQQGQLESLLDNLLASSVLDFADAQEDGEWHGTSTALLELLTQRLPHSATRSREWPTNPIALSKRLVGLQASLLTQGVRIEITRSKHRIITITKQGGRDE